MLQDQYLADVCALAPERGVDLVTVTYKAKANNLKA
jgi:hypothetical protein